MKYVFAILALLSLVNAAQASGLVTDIYLCSEQRGDYTAAVTLKRMQVSAPGISSQPYYVATVRTSNGARTVDSGEVRVRPFIPMDGGPELYINNEHAFSLSIHSRSGVNGAGRAANILVEASFKEARARVYSGITKRWMTCR